MASLQGREPPVHQQAPMTLRTKILRWLRGCSLERVVLEISPPPACFWVSTASQQKLRGPHRASAEMWGLTPTAVYWHHQPGMCHHFPPGLLDSVSVPNANTEK